MSTKPLGMVVFLSVAALGMGSAAIAQEAPPAPKEASAEADQGERVSPRIILETQKPPKYPPAAKAARYTGSVNLETVVQTDGTVGEVKVLECTRPKVGFEQAAIDAVKKWKFEPGRLDDEPVEVTLRFRLNFSPGGISLGSEYIPAGASTGSDSSSASAGTSIK